MLNVFIIKAPVLKNTGAFNYLLSAIKKCYLPNRPRKKIILVKG